MSAFYADVSPVQGGYPVRNSEIQTALFITSTFEEFIF